MDSEFKRIIKRGDELLGFARFFKKETVGGLGGGRVIVWGGVSGSANDGGAVFFEIEKLVAENLEGEKIFCDRGRGLVGGVKFG